MYHVSIITYVWRSCGMYVLYAVICINVMACSNVAANSQYVLILCMAIIKWRNSNVYVIQLTCNGNVCMYVCMYVNVNNNNIAGSMYVCMYVCMCGMYVCGCMYVA
jgi:hypothetical protein